MNHLRRHLLLGLTCLLALGGLAREGVAEPQGAQPEFALRDVDGAVRRLSEHRGKWVVLEWVNFACEPVTQHYQAPGRRMQALQRAAMSRGVVWLCIDSTSPGQPGYVTSQEGKQTLARLGAQPTALLLDPTGAVGKQFRAQVTPEARVVSPQGEVVYAGGVEHLHTVLDAATTGRALPFATQPVQGCRIPYATVPSLGGPKAPDFALKDNAGVVRRLSDFRGKWVVLEWVNYDCPFVFKHYNPAHRNMQRLQALSARQGVVWLSICSSAPGKQGHFAPAQVGQRMRRLGAAPAAYLHDPNGAVGRSYGAKTTPDIRVISPQGTLEYAGGIDNMPSARASDVARAKNFLALALADIAARRPIAIKQSRPYGCSVKY